MKIRKKKPNRKKKACSYYTLQTKNASSVVCSKIRLWIKPALALKIAKPATKCHCQRHLPRPLCFQL